MLKNLHSHIAPTLAQNNTTLLYRQRKGLPREFQGNAEPLQKLLQQLLGAILPLSHTNEIVLSLASVDEFLFEEMVSFAICNTGINEQDLLSLYDECTIKMIKALEGELIDIDGADIAFEVPMRNKELGSLRHYRLSHDKLLHKKVWIAAATPLSTETFRSFFEYFNYQVEDGLDKLNILSSYDILVVEHGLLTEAQQQKVLKGYQEKGFYLIGIGQKESSSPLPYAILLDMPLLQQDVFSALESMKTFQAAPIQHPEEMSVGIPQQTTQEISLDRMMFHVEMEERDNNVDTLAILDVTRGERQHDNNPLMYKQSLKIFIAKYKHTSPEFKQMVTDKEIFDLKTFTEKLETDANKIGAMRLAHFMETLDLVIKHEEYHMLDMNILKYRIALSQLMQEIDKV